MGNPANDYRGSVAQRYDGPWMSADVLGALPQLKHDYQREADPEREAMRLHLQKPEAQRRQESVAHQAQQKAQASLPDDKSARTARDQTDQSSGEQSDGRGSAMVGKDQPKPALRPPERIARSVDETAFKAAWLAEQRDAAFATAKQHRAQTTQEHEKTHSHQPQYLEPTR